MDSTPRPKLINQSRANYKKGGVDVSISSATQKKARSGSLRGVERPCRSTNAMVDCSVWIMSVVKLTERAPPTPPPPPRPPLSFCGDTSDGDTTSHMYSSGPLKGLNPGRRGRVSNRQLATLHSMQNTSNWLRALSADWRQLQAMLRVLFGELITQDDLTRGALVQQVISRALQW